MRVHFFVLFLVVLAIPFFSDSFWITTLKDSDIGYYQDSIVFVEYSYPRKPIFVQRMYKNDKHLQNGFYFIKLRNLSEQNDYDRVYLLEGKGIVIRYFSSEREISINKKVTKESIDTWIDKKLRNQRRKNVFDTAFKNIEYHHHPS